MKQKTRLQKIREFNIALCRLEAFMLRSKISFRRGEAHRTKAQALINAKKGVGIKNSKHIKSLGQDYWMTDKGWDIVWDQNDPRYYRMGMRAELLGLTWGGRWRRRDAYHVEYKGRV